jgi:hypothetical protein
MKSVHIARMPGKPHVVQLRLVRGAHLAVQPYHREADSLEVRSQGCRIVARLLPWVMRILISGRGCRLIHPPPRSTRDGRRNV